jgi:hypothetical protein
VQNLITTGSSSANCSRTLAWQSLYSVTGEFVQEAYGCFLLDELVIIVFEMLSLGCLANLAAKIHSL